MLYRYFLRIFLSLAVIASLAGAMFGQTESVLYNFTGGSDGGHPAGGLLLNNGVLYGTAAFGGVAPGIQGCGVVFSMTKTGSQSVLWTFQGAPNDGCGPEGDLVADAQGNLYGTTIAGGTSSNEGVIFRVTPLGSQTILYNFSNAFYSGRGRVALDQKRNLLYAVARQVQPGNYSLWFILRLDLATLTPTTFYSFGVANDGSVLLPVGDLAIDGAGNLYGATVNGGSAGFGSVFKITPADTYKTIYNFQNAADGAAPQSVVLYKGNLYGVTGSGPMGTSNPVVFRVTKKGILTPLYTTSVPADQPGGTLSFDSLGNIYGIAGSNPGSIYELIQPPPFTHQTLYTFAGPPSDGAIPVGRLVISAKGVYGVTTFGGADCSLNNNYCGAVFKIALP